MYRYKICSISRTVICEYLEERFPTPALLPQGAAERARARWIEEFADTRMGDVFIWRIFYEAVVNPFIWQRPRDKEKIARGGGGTAGGDGPSRAPGAGVRLPVRGGVDR
jgi:glutathione S-transferase